jgi:hypothetical protein
MTSSGAARLNTVIHNPYYCIYHTSVVSMNRVRVVGAVCGSLPLVLLLPRKHKQDDLSQLRQSASKFNLNINPSSSFLSLFLVKTCCFVSIYATYYQLAHSDLSIKHLEYISITERSRVTLPRAGRIRSYSRFRVDNWDSDWSCRRMGLLYCRYNTRERAQRSCRLSSYAQLC